MLDSLLQALNTQNGRLMVIMVITNTENIKKNLLPEKKKHVKGEQNVSQDSLEHSECEVYRVFPVGIVGETTCHE